MKKIKLMLVPLLFALVSCGGSDDDGTVNGPGGNNNNNNGTFGESIQIPDIDALAGTGSALDMRTTNEGVYINVYHYDDDTNWTYRLQQGGPSPDWIKHEQHELYFNYHPANPYYENPDEFSVFFMTVNTYGLANINNGSPALQEDDIPFWNGATYMAMDNSPQAYTWAADGNEIFIKGANQQFESICTLPSSVEFMEPSPDDAVMWVASGAVLYKVTASGDVTEFDVNSFHNPDYFLTGINKVRFSEDDVIFNCEDKIFKISNGNTMSLHYTFTEYFGMGLGPDFAVDGSYIYTSQGDVVRKSDGDIVANIIPEAPSANDPDKYLEYLTNVNNFKVGRMEVSTDPLNNSIYVLANDKILVVPKKLYAGQY